MFNKVVSGNCRNSVDFFLNFRRGSLRGGVPPENKQVVSDYNGYTTNNAIRENKSNHCDCYRTGFEGSVHETEMMRSNENNVFSYD